MRTAPETVDEWMDRKDGYGNGAMNETCVEAQP